MRYSFGLRWILFWGCVVCSNMNVWAKDVPNPISAPTSTVSHGENTTNSGASATIGGSATDKEVVASGGIVTADDAVAVKAEEKWPIPSSRAVSDLVASPLLALYKSYQERLSISTTAAATAAVADGSFPALLNFTDGLHYEIPSLQPNDLNDWVDGGKWSLCWTGVVIRSMRDIRDWDPDQKYFQGAVPGYLIRCVMPNSPASRAGLVSGDILLEMENESGETTVVNGFSWWQWMRMRPPRDVSETPSRMFVRFLRRGELLQTQIYPASASELPIFPHVWGHPSMPLGRLMIGIRPDGVVENVYVFWRPNGVASFMLFWQDPTKPASASMSILEPNGGMYQVLKTEDLRAIPSVYIDYATHLWKDGQAEPAKIWVSSNRSGKSQSISYAKYAREQGINVEWVERLAKLEGIELPPIRKLVPEAAESFPRNDQHPDLMNGVRTGRDPEMEDPLIPGSVPEGAMGRGSNGLGMGRMGVGRRVDNISDVNPWEMANRPIPGEVSVEGMEADGMGRDRPRGNPSVPFTLPFSPQEGDLREMRGRNRGNPWVASGSNGVKLTTSVMNPEMDALRTELRELRESVQQLQQTIVELNKRLDSLKK